VLAQGRPVAAITVVALTSRLSVPRRFEVIAQIWGELKRIGLAQGDAPPSD
jgi:DNA-binding IclR family transcriptional regulator